MNDRIGKPQGQSSETLTDMQLFILCKQMESKTREKKLREGEARKDLRGRAQAGRTTQVLPQPGVEQSVR